MDEHLNSAAEPHLQFVEMISVWDGRKRLFPKNCFVRVSLVNIGKKRIWKCFSSHFSLSVDHDKHEKITRNKEHGMW
jgi:hypothetical protein